MGLFDKFWYAPKRNRIIQCGICYLLEEAESVVDDYPEVARELTNDARHLFKMGGHGDSQTLMKINYLNALYLHTLLKNSFRSS